LAAAEDRGKFRQRCKERKRERERERERERSLGERDKWKPLVAGRFQNGVAWNDVVAAAAAAAAALVVVALSLLRCRCC